jgi:hypothetical protein
MVGSSRFRGMPMRRTCWQSDHHLDEIEALIARAQDCFREKLEAYLSSDVSQMDAYHRYLSFQYHMTRGVQSYFFRVAASRRLAKMRKLRVFLTTFAQEEELHYLVAASDLRSLGLEILPEPFDVSLWHAYFRSIVDESPFMRLGAALILENISDGVARPSVRKALSADFMTRENTKFLVLHQHEVLPHGDQLLEAITSVPLEERDIADLIRGAKQGTLFYLRTVDWALGFDQLLAAASEGPQDLAHHDIEAIDTFRMEDLQLDV